MRPAPSKNVPAVIQIKSYCERQGNERSTVTTDIPYIRPRIFGTYQWISPKIAYKTLPQIAFYFVG